MARDDPPLQVGGQEWLKNLISVRAGSKPVDPGEGQRLELVVGGRGEGGSESTNVRLRGPQGRAGEGREGCQRKQDLAEAPTSPIRKQPPRQPLTPHGNLCQAKEGEGHSRQWDGSGRGKAEGQC